jgi:hypothetical protein
MTMKTPRELLLQRHRSVAARLDSIRREIVADLPSPRNREEKRQITAGFLREFLLPLRWHLAGMSAIWVLVALLNTEGPSTNAAIAWTSSSSSQTLAALFENRRQLTEMIKTQGDEPATSSPLPEPFVPRRRSALQPPSVAV